MATPISQFDYELPSHFIAQLPAEPRDHSRLMLLDRKSGNVRHRHFFEIVYELKAGDVLVFNTSKVFKARLQEGKTEVFVLKIATGEVEALIKPGRKFPAGSVFTLFGHDFVVTKVTSQGTYFLKTSISVGEMLDFCEKWGKVPTPPYVKENASLDEKYQTVYAEESGSVAAPTAGFHFTTQLLNKLEARGIQFEYVVLHVGLGTFRPVQTATLEDHVMHSEWIRLDEATAQRLKQAKSEGRRIIAVGTTTTRVLEGIASQFAELRSYEGEMNLFIKPGFEFQVIDGLITNFHLPKSTLLVLVSSFAGRENIIAAYEEAKRCGYRFYSFGDAMFIY